VKLAKTKADRKRHLVLIGFSGSGKTTVGKALADHLGWRFCDTDNLISRLERMSVSEIFRSRGEAHFRRAETRIIAQVMVRQRHTVIALGGGAFMERRNLVLAQSNAIVVYLKCSVLELYRRLKNSDDRPLLQNGTCTREQSIAQIKRLLNRRKKGYEQSDMIVSVTRKTTSAISHEIVRSLGL
jgi:shikimate kinase